MTNEEILKKVEEAARAEIDRYQLPSIFNYETTNQKGLELAQKLGADIFVVELGTRLMDLKLGQAKEQDRLSQHVVMSSEAAVKLLSDSQVERPIIEKVKNCIEGHHKAVPWTCPEAEICANADCYRFLLLPNWLQFLCSLVSREMSFVEAVKYAQQKFEEKLAILSLNEAKKELDSDIKLIRQIIDKIIHNLTAGGIAGI